VVAQHHIGAVQGESEILTFIGLGFEEGSGDAGIEHGYCRTVLLDAFMPSKKPQRIQHDHNGASFVRNHRHTQRDDANS